ncbi:MAG: phosphatase [Chloroflexi bacterium HGW-Chloroflexi-8]|jgi:protein tyrosine phosphatase (PTP) superfamily phosphohydrolase (DUF442 family)|nr:MAG: phosphatase [Chloroflexi bacterium HGW-Chloroflexi-8]
MNVDLNQITNFYAITEQLLTGGMPTVEQLKHLQNEDVDVVINLALDDSPNALSKEMEILQDLGMTYVQIPVEWENPRLSDLEKFFDIMEKYKSRKLFVHCVLNMRVSVFIYLYRMIKDHIPAEIAILDVRRIWDPNPIWQTFIELSLNQFNEIEKPG